MILARFLAVVNIYSQLKTVASSEVAAMLEGLLHHGTEMDVEKNYVDSGGHTVILTLVGYSLQAGAGAAPHPLPGRGARPHGGALVHTPRSRVASASPCPLSPLLYIRSIPHMES
jgi:Tn3 transposase DDE domain